MPFQDHPDISVLVCTPTHRDFHVQTLRSYLETQEACRGLGISIEFNFFVSSLVHHSRSLAAHTFMRSRHNRLFWIDSDIVWRAADFVRLLEHSLKVDCVCAAYPVKREAPAFYVRFTESKELDEDGLISIRGTGLGFCCVARGVIETLTEKAPKLRFTGKPEPMASIFRCDEENGEARGEDMAFFADCLAAGFRVKADPTIQLTHLGVKEYSGRLADVLKA
jgi:hypothetical protein